MGEEVLLKRGSKKSVKKDKKRESSKKSKKSGKHDKKRRKTIDSNGTATNEGENFVVEG